MPTRDNCAFSCAKEAGNTGEVPLVDDTGDIIVRFGVSNIIFLDGL